MSKIEKEKIKTWFITGGSSGIGYKLSLELLNRGYNVITISRTKPQITHPNVLCISADVTKPDEIKNAISEGIKRFGRIDVLSNNAGISANITLEDETLDHMKEVMETNFFGTFNAIQAILPHFRENKNGTIINNTSQSGLTPRSLGSAYCSSKHALEGLTGVLWTETAAFCRVMALELGGFTETEIFKKQKQVKTQIPEYSNLPNCYVKFLLTFENDLNLAINYIIEQVEQKKLPRRLMLGKDAVIKVDAEIKYLKKDFLKSKNRALRCAKMRKDLHEIIYRKIKKILFKSK